MWSLTPNTSHGLKITTSSTVLMYMVEIGSTKWAFFSCAVPNSSNEFFRHPALISPLREEMSYGCCISFRLLAISPLHTVFGAQATRGVSGWFTTGIQAFLFASLPRAQPRASQPLALQPGGHCVFALAPILPIFSFLNSMMVLLTDHVCYLRK